MRSVKYSNTRLYDPLLQRVAFLHEKEYIRNKIVSLQYLFIVKYMSPKFGKVVRVDALLPREQVTSRAEIIHPSLGF